jgi:hypothetical protein
MKNAKDTMQVDWDCVGPARSASQAIAANWRSPCRAWWDGASVGLCEWFVMETGAGRPILVTTLLFYHFQFGRISAFTTQPSGQRP